MKQIKLLKLYNKFLLEISEIERSLLICDYTNSNSASRKYIAEYSLIRLQDAWSNYCRDMIVCSSIFETIDLNNKLYTKGPHNIKTLSGILDKLRNEWVTRSGGRNRKPSYWEPNWYDPQHVAIALTILRINNPNVGGAIALSTNPIEDLRPVRNFAAHRGRDTRVELEIAMGNATSSLALILPSSWEQPVDIISTTLAASGETIFDEWIRRFKKVARAMIS